MDVTPGDPAYEYRPGGHPLPADPSKKTATGRRVVVQLKHIAKHPDIFIAYTAFPK
ncbi:hypothetical protein [Kitasatospora sp. NPDC057015]|uniref:hypothetical protein n=1 Tax=Kitasatospora sp. NPDC057015 TaxID=3346001 RepID=UPI003645B672